MQKFSVAGGSAPTPPCLRRLGASPRFPDLRQPSCFQFLTTRIFRLFHHFWLEAVISSEINFSLNNDLRLNVPNCEDLWLDVDFSSHNLKYTSAVIYRHPCNNHPTFFEALDEKLQIINNRRSTAMVMGDFNIDLSGDNNRSLLADYLQILQSNAFVSIVNLPTRITPTSQTIIDHIFTNDSVSVITPGIFKYQISDHRPIFCTLTDTKLKTSGIKASYTLRNTSSLDRQNFLNDLNDALLPVTHNFTLLTPDKQYNNFDAYFTKVITALSEMIDQNASLHSVSRKQKRLQHSPWITKGTVISIKTKQNLYRNFF